MSFNIQCQSCQGNFDGQNKIPMILPCEHNICAECSFQQHQQTKSITCVYQSCQVIHKINPIKLQEDTPLLKYLESYGLLDNISVLENQQASIKTVRVSLDNQQINFIQQLMKHINQYIFKDSLALQKEIKQVAKEIKQKLNQLRVQQNLINKNQQGISLQFQQLSQDNPQLSQRVQKLQADSQ